MFHHCGCWARAGKFPFLGARIRTRVTKNLGSDSDSNPVGLGFGLESYPVRLGLDLRHAGLGLDSDSRETWTLFPITQPELITTESTTHLPTPSDRNRMDIPSIFSKSNLLELYPGATFNSDTLWHACIDFLTCSDNHPCRQSGLCPSGERSRSSRRGKCEDLPIISSGFEIATVVEGLYNASSIMPDNPLTTVRHICPTRCVATA